MHVNILLETSKIKLGTFKSIDRSTLNFQMPKYTTKYTLKGKKIHKRCYINN